MRFQTLLQASATVAVSHASSHPKPEPLVCSKCPEGLSIVEIHPEVCVEIHPVHISTYVPHNTVLTVGDATVKVTNAPTKLVTDFKVTETVTVYHTGSPELYLTCPTEEHTATHSYPHPTHSKTKEHPPHPTHSKTKEHPPHPTQTKPAECIPPPPPPESCPVLLPGDCTKMEKMKGMDLVPAVASCSLALGPYAVGNIATCLAKTNINPATLGAEILNCVQTALEERCIVRLPDVCDKLEGAKGPELILGIADCAVGLGPFVAGSVATCLVTDKIKDETEGITIVECLNLAFGFPPKGPPHGEHCPPPPPEEMPDDCDNMPQACEDLTDIDGLGLLVALPLCVAALGVRFAGDVAQCATGIIGATSSGQSIAECIQESLHDLCVS